jgi:hypothetical protein
MTDVARSNDKCKRVPLSFMILEKVCVDMSTQACIYLVVLAVGYLDI